MMRHELITNAVTGEVTMRPLSDGENARLDAEEAALLEQERAAQSLSFPQLLIGLSELGFLSQEEALGWSSGVIPSSILATINLLPKGQQFQMRIMAAQPATVSRSSALMSMLATKYGMKPEALDMLFRTYATV